ncbi:MAG: aminopeptidase N [Leptospira sp.]|nr:aminopeptidase N [Leptospira sp.]
MDQKTAENRAKQVTNVRYDISLDITKKETFHGVTSIHFDFIKNDSPLRVDLANAVIESVQVNNKTLQGIDYEKGHFMISVNHLSPGRNTIKVAYTHPFSRSGNGLHIFNDPEDNETYIYSQFETNHAQAMFPCFDQPDIKASYKLDVLHPKKWKIVTANLADKKTSENEFTRSYFPETLVFSTYIFSLHAGPYAEWMDRYGKLSLKLYARKSMAKYVDHKLWFQVTKQGLRFFEKYFGIDYPFSKYDQLIVPEFNFGAMENVGAVTFSERFLSRGKVTRSGKEKLASVILHEMAHMWFGNLVTMKWWDGLWLNESFATYLAAKAQYEATEFKEAWETFFTGMKSWAYKADKSITTHPIQGKVSDTEEAFTNFDGITYGKGASVLKQLEFFIGEEEFRVGVSNYLKKYSYSNATLLDFLTSLEESSGRDLKKWSSEWLESEGFNRLLAEKTCDSSGKYLESIQLTQDHITNTKIPRSHKTQLALIKLQSNKPVLMGTQTVEYGEGITKIKWNTEVECPDFIFSNYGDYDFVRTDYPSEILEEKNLSTLKSILQGMDTLSTLMIWRDLFEEVRDGDLSLNRYKNLTMDILPQDKRDIVLESNLGHITSPSFSSYHSFLYLKKQSDRQLELEELEEYTWKHMLGSPSQSDRKKLWFRGYVAIGQSNDFFQRTIQLLTNKESISGLSLDQDMRWSLLKKICSLTSDRSRINELLDAEKKRDSSRIGLNSALACEAATPDPVTKGIWMNRFTKPNEVYSPSTLRTVLHYIFPIHQKNLQIPFVEYFYQNIKEGKIEGDENYQETYAYSLAPSFCTEENRHILRKFINNNRNLPANILKSLKIKLESEEECLLIRKKNGF